MVTLLIKGQFNVDWFRFMRNGVDRMQRTLYNDPSTERMTTAKRDMTVLRESVSGSATNVPFKILQQAAVSISPAPSVQRGHNRLHVGG